VLAHPTGLENVLEWIQQTFSLEGTFALSLPCEQEDFVTPCIMACVSSHDQALAHDLLFRWQEKHFLPPCPFLHTLVSEAIASYPSSLSQADRFKSLASLPFGGFLRTGAIKHVDSRRPLVRTLFTQLVTLPDCLQNTALCCADRQQSDQLVQSISMPLAERQPPQDFDPLLDAYVKGFAPAPDLFGTLFLHHILTRLLRVRQKEEKVLLHTHVERSCKDLSTSERIHALLLCARLLPTLHPSSRMQSKVFGFVLLNVLKLDSFDLATADDMRTHIGRALEQIPVTVDLMRDLTKAYELHKFGEWLRNNLITLRACAY
jgi:hypothetical protein